MTASSLRRAYADCRFGQLHYLAGGARTGRPTLLFLHQNPSSFIEYELLIQEMAKDRPVLAFDTPGNGMSDRPPGPQSIMSYAGAFSDALDDLGADRLEAPIDVFGYHTGASLALDLAIQRPDLVGRLALSGIGMRTPEERAQRLADIHATPDPTDDGEEVFEKLRWLWKFVVGERLPGVTMERAAQVFMEKAKPLHRAWWPYEGVWTYPIEERLAMVGQPTLILGPEEPLTDASRRAAGMMRDARFEHMPHLSRDVFDVGVGDFAAAMRGFLT